MKTKITELLGIKYPVFQGAMAWIADAELAASVSNAGGMGIIAAGTMEPELLRAEIKKAKTLTDKPFGVNLMLMSPFVNEHLKVILEEKPAAVTTGAGNPAPFIKALKAEGIKVFPVTPGVSLAKFAERAGADGIIAEGTESGGHIGNHATMSLVPQVVSAVKIPVIAAGGIASGEGMAAAVCLGAEGVQCGTVFVASEECNVSDAYKDMILKANDNSTAVTGRSVGLAVRSLKSKLISTLDKMEKEEKTALEIEEFTAGSLRKAVKDGNIEEGQFMSGQVAGLIKSVKKCEDIIKEMVFDAEKIIKEKVKLF